MFALALAVALERTEASGCHCVMDQGDKVVVELELCREMVHQDDDCAQELQEHW